MSIKKAAEYLGASEYTLRDWERKGKIKPTRTLGNQRRYTKEMLDEMLTNTKRVKSKLIIGYCRVSSSHQQKDLARQVEVVQAYCEKQGQPFKIIKDIGSGLNYKRKGFLELIHLICTKQCNEIVVNYQDRLARFGFDLIQAITDENQVKLTVINQTEQNDPNQELVEDVLTVITVFSAKLYGKRSHKNAKIVKENQELFSQDS
mgnify:CR=1 FL=1